MRFILPVTLPLAPVVRSSLPHHSRSIAEEWPLCPTTATPQNQEGMLELYSSLVCVCAVCVDDVLCACACVYTCEHKCSWVDTRGCIGCAPYFFETSSFSEPGICWFNWTVCVWASGVHRSQHHLIPKIDWIMETWPWAQIFMWMMQNQVQSIKVSCGTSYHLSHSHISWYQKLADSYFKLYSENRLV